MSLPRFIDAHMHVWNTVDGTHSEKYLGNEAVTRFPVYLATEYEQSMAKYCDLEAAVFIEAIPDDPIEEVNWVESLGSEKIKKIVAYADLGASNVDEILAKLTRNSKVVGIRHVLNHHADDPALVWPRVAHDRYLKDDASFHAGFALLSKYNLSFDLHVNPHQLKDAATFLSQFPNTQVVLDHIGTLKLPTKGDGESGSDALESALSVWREGMSALAQLKNVHVKISMLSFARKDWHCSEEGRAEIRGIVREVIAMFGVERCMFATNSPVDEVLGLGHEAQMGQFVALAGEYSEEECACLLAETAARFYRIR